MIKRLFILILFVLTFMSMSVVSADWSARSGDYLSSSTTTDSVLSWLPDWDVSMPYYYTILVDAGIVSHDDYVFFVTTLGDENSSRLHCYDITTGGEVWSCLVEIDDNIVHDIVVDTLYDLVYVYTTVVGEFDEVVAIDIDLGTVMWTYEMDDETDGGGLTFFNYRLYVATDSLYCIQHNQMSLSADLVFKVLEGLGSTTVVYSGSILMTTASQYVYALNYTTGAQLWNISMGSDLSALNIQGSLITFTDVDYVYAYYYSTQVQSWNISKSGDDLQQVSGDMVSYGVYADNGAGENYYVKKFLHTDGSEEWVASLDNPIYTNSLSPVVIADDQVFAIDNSSIIYCWEFDTGALDWSRDYSEYLNQHSNLLVDEDRLVVAFPDLIIAFGGDATSFSTPTPTPTSSGTDLVETELPNELIIILLVGALIAIAIGVYKTFDISDDNGAVKVLMVICVIIVAVILMLWVVSYVG